MQQSIACSSHSYHNPVLYRVITLLVRHTGLTAWLAHCGFIPYDGQVDFAWCKEVVKEV